MLTGFRKYRANIYVDARPWNCSYVAGRDFVISPEDAKRGHPKEGDYIVVSQPTGKLLLVSKNQFENQFSFVNIVDL